MRVSFDNSGFDVIKEALKDNYKTRVGILGSKGSEQRDGLTNAEIGAIHEFGSLTRGIPRRSFLKNPLEDNIMKWVKNNADTYKNLMEKGNLKKWYVALGFEAEKIIDNAFSSGYDWEPLKQSTIDKKGSDKILIDTGELRRAISSKVMNAND